MISTKARVYIPVVALFSTDKRILERLLNLKRTLISDNKRHLMSRSWITHKMNLKPKITNKRRKYRPTFSMYKVSAPGCRSTSTILPTRKSNRLISKGRSPSAPALPPLFPPTDLVFGCAAGILGFWDSACVAV